MVVHSGDMNCLDLNLPPEGPLDKVQGQEAEGAGSGPALSVQIGDHRIVVRLHQDRMASDPREKTLKGQEDS